MDYVVGNPLARVSSSEQPTVKRFAGQADIQSASPSKTQSKYLNQGQSWAEEERKKQQDMLDAQAAGETGGSTVSLGDYGQLQLK